MPVLTMAAAALGWASGCSFVFAQGPPAPAHQASATYFDCGETYAPPILDTAVAGLSLVAAVGAKDNANLSDPAVTAGIYAGFAALYAASSVYGYGAVSACREAKGARAARIQREQGLPPPYGLPPYGFAPPFWPPPAATPRAVAAPPPAANVIPDPAEAPQPLPDPVFKPAPPAGQGP